MAIPFVKMHGLGNDFVIVDARDSPERSQVALPEKTRELANRRTGIGCDQLIVLERVMSCCFLGGKCQLSFFSFRATRQTV